MMRTAQRTSLSAIVAVALWALGACLDVVPAMAADSVGSVAALEGRAEAQRSDGATWAPLAAGDAVYLNDRVRTLADSRLKLLFGEDAVVTMGPKSEMTIDEQVVPEEGGNQSYFSVLVGTVRALVSERYGAPGGSFEMETPTAVAAVRGTEFVVAHSVMADETTVLGIANKTLVRARVDEEGTSVVELGPGEVTTVKRGSVPMAPAPASEDVLQSLSGATSMAQAAGSRGVSGAQKAAGGGGARAAQSVDAPVKQVKEIKQQQDAGRPAPPPPPIPR